MICTSYNFLYAVQVVGLREENIERRRQRILTATRELIGRDGVDGWSMRKVADAADVSVPTLYNLFGSKDEIRAALVGGFFDELDRSLDDGAPPDNPIERVLAFAAAGVDTVLARAATTRPALLAQEHGGGGEHRTTPMAIERQRAAFQAAMDAGHLRTDLRADHLAAQAHDGFHRAAILWARDKLDASAFRSRALYAVCVCLLAVATDESRLELLGVCRDLEPDLDPRTP